MSSSYYSDKIESLKDIFFSNNIILSENELIVDGRVYPIIEDVIVLLSPSEYPPSLQAKTANNSEQNSNTPAMARDIQFTFGEEWKTYNKVLPEHKVEFELYFDIVDLASLKDKRVCDLGCGIGRWSYFLADKCRELVLVDFSDAIFVARENLRQHQHAIFFLGDLTRLPFRNAFADFLFCLGVLHHLPFDALEITKKIGSYAPRLMIYLYYALDNRAIHYRWLLHGVTAVRHILSRIHNPHGRTALTWLLTLLVYLPLVGLGHAFDLVKLGRLVPLYEGYANKSIHRIRQDVYDRFFTRIEQRFSKQEILTLHSHFEKITVSDGMPYWHFLCESKSRDESSTC